MLVSSTRDPALRTTFAEAAERNTPGDGGLYLPVVAGGAGSAGAGAGGLVPFADVEALLALPFRRRSAEILFRLLEPELTRDEIAAMVDGALDFPLPHREIGPGISALELFHGPSLSFKDFGVRFLAQVLAWLRRRDAAAPPQIVLTATSGDTGAAVVHAFHGLPGFGVAVLYPAGRISPLQERQIATLGGNVRAFAVAGSFDDCQRMVSSAFADPALASRLRLVSANSIHLARLLAQVTYYFEAAAGAPRRRPLVVSVPSGNFGNLCAGLLAQRLGAPIAALVAATNANRTVPDFLEGRPYTPRASTATLSNAMDVGAPNNWQRIERLFDGDGAAMRRGLRWGSADDAATRDALAELGRRGYRADPHAAVAFDVLRRNLRDGEHGLFLATAHPAKFEVSRDEAAALPAPLAAAAALSLLAEPMAADAAALRAPLLDLAHRLRS
jgi:threonine synthase